MILVTGCARSGTSLTTGILRACGANTGKVNGLNEHMGVREKLVKPYLSKIGADPMGQYPLPERDWIEPDPDWRNKVLKMLGKGVDTYKGAKMCLFWPLWVEHFPDAKWIIVRRDREKIIDSCLRTRFMQKHKDRKGWGQWVDTHLQRFAELKANADCVEVWPDMEPETFRPAIEFCGLTYDADAVRNQLQPGHWHG